MLREHEVTTPAGVGRRVFIKGLAATGALVGGMAVGGPALAQEAAGVPARGRGRRPSPFSQGWTSQPGRFYDDVSLPEASTSATTTARQIELEQYAVGGAVIRVVRKGGGPWAPVPDHTYGSLANCAGGITPWGTALSAEENRDDNAEDYGWGPDFAAENNGGYGWILEVDPMDPDWVPRKHTNPGRLGHENATVWAREGRPWSPTPATTPATSSSRRRRWRPTSRSRNAPRPSRPGGRARCPGPTPAGRSATARAR